MESAVRGTDIRTSTLEAFADTIIPGERRWPDDVAIAGISAGGGAVAAGAVALLETPEGGMAPLLDDLVTALNAHAAAYCELHGLPADPAAAFVGLAWEHRAALVRRLTAPDHPEKQLWVGIAMFCNMAFDTGAPMHTTDALATGHPGLVAMGFARPDADGLWRSPEYSYRKVLAPVHPGTTQTGSPA